MDDIVGLFLELVAVAFIVTTLVVSTLAVGVGCLLYAGRFAWRRSCQARETRGEKSPD